MVLCVAQRSARRCWWSTKLDHFKVGSAARRLGVGFGQRFVLSHLGDIAVVDKRSDFARVPHILKDDVPQVSRNGTLIDARYHERVPGHWVDVGFGCRFAVGGLFFRRGVLGMVDTRVDLADTLLASTLFAIACSRYETSDEASIGFWLARLRVADRFLSSNGEGPGDGCDNFWLLVHRNGQTLSKGGKTTRWLRLWSRYRHEWQLPDISLRCHLALPKSYSGRRLDKKTPSRLPRQTRYGSRIWRWRWRWRVPLRYMYLEEGICLVVAMKIPMTWMRWVTVVKVEDTVSVRINGGCDWME